MKEGKVWSEKRISNKDIPCQTTKKIVLFFFYYHPPKFFFYGKKKLILFFYFWNDLFYWSSKGNGIWISNCGAVFIFLLLFYILEKKNENDIMN